MLYLHGGGYQVGSLRSHGPLAAELGRVTGRRVLLPEYRLAPEHPFPAAVEDTLAAWRWMVSGGGGLALALLQHLRDTGEDLPAGAVLISPFLDLTASGASLTERAGQDPVFTADAVRGFAAVYLNGADPREPAASPLLGSQKALPPLRCC
jgi:epsilon-lactone hydrolase